MIDFKQLIEKIENNTCDAILDLGYKSYDDEQIKMIANALGKNTSIKALRLSGNHIGQNGGQAIEDALKANKTLELLDLSDTTMDYWAGHYVAIGLAWNNTLKAIDLSNNGLTLFDGIARVLVDALKRNHTLTEIELGGNHPDERRADAIADALKVNQILKSIRPECNSLGPYTRRVFADTLKANLALASDFQSGGLWGSGLRDSVKLNRALIDSGFAINNLGSETSTALTEALNANLMMATDRLSWRFHGSEIQLIELMRDYCKSTKIYNDIQLIRKEIQHLYSDTPLPLKAKSKESIREHKETKETKEPKETTDEFDYKKYQSLLALCLKLEKEGCRNTTVQALKDEAMLALCSWDNYATIDYRLGELTTIAKRYQNADSFPVGKAISLKALSLLAHVYLTKAMNVIQKQKKQAFESQEYLLLAYTVGIHGSQDEFAKRDVIMASSLFTGQIRVDLEDPQELLQDLFKNNLEKFKALKEGYFRQCKTLGLKPKSLFEEIEKAVALGALPSAKKPLIFSATQSIGAQSTLGLDEDVALFDRKP